MSRVRVVVAALAVALVASGCGGLFAGPEMQRFEAVFPRTNNLFVGSEVKVLGIRVGRVASLETLGPSVLARLEVQPDVAVPADVRARIKPLSLLGERFVQLDPPYTEGPTLETGARIPLERTGVPAEVDEVLASFERFLSALDDDAVAGLVTVLSETLAGQGEELNTLIDQAATTLRVLSDASEDLVGVAQELGQLNESVATRDAQLGQVIEDWAVVVRTIADESGEIIEGVGHLRRLAAVLRSIVEEHGDPLVRDLEVLATTTATVQRNLDRIGLMIFGARDLFEAAGRGVEFPDARISLNNQAEPLAEAIALRLTTRLVGVCLRLGIEECQIPLFWEPIVPAMVCIEGFVPCVEDRATVAEVIAAALGRLPPEAVDQLAAEAAERGDAGDDPTDPPSGADAGAPRSGLPGLRDAEGALDRPTRPTWRDRLASFFGGGS